MDQSFSKSLILTKKRDIDLLFSEGKRIRSQSFGLLFLPVEDADSSFRILISVPKKNIKKAVDRNYIKRCIREVLRKNKELLMASIPDDYAGYHLGVIYTLKNKMNYGFIEENLLKALHKISIVK